MLGVVLHFDLLLEVVLLVVELLLFQLGVFSLLQLVAHLLQETLLLLQFLHLVLFVVEQFFLLQLGQVSSVFDLLDLL